MNHWSIVKQLLHLGAKPSGKEEWRSIMLYSNPSMLEALLKAGLKVNEKMLEFAYMYAGIMFVDTLLKYGANPNTVLKNGNTVLANEIDKGVAARIGVIKSLLKYGAHIDDDLIEAAKSKCKPNIVAALEWAKV